LVGEEALEVMLAALRPHLNEKQWRLLLGAGAEAVGWGGIGLVARLSGASRTAIDGLGGSIDPADSTRSALQARLDGHLRDLDGLRSRAANAREMYGSLLRSAARRVDAGGTP
jgi:hypothetical protein